MWFSAAHTRLVALEALLNLATSPYALQLFLLFSSFLRIS